MKKRNLCLPCVPLAKILSTEDTEDTESLWNGPRSVISPWGGLVHDAECPQDVVEIGEEHEEEEYSHAGVFGVYHELVARLAPCDHLIEQEEHVASVEGRDREDVHECEDDREECSHHPEHVPVPCRREHRTDGSETAKLLGTVRGEDVFQVADVTAEHVEGIAYAGRYAGDDIIIYVCHLSILADGGHANTEVSLFVECHRTGDGIAIGLRDKGHGACESLDGVALGLAVAESIEQSTALIGEVTP